jgi:transcriptional regulator with XRE-family HTH domain
MGIAREVVDYYERRAKNPSMETIQKVAHAFNVEPAYFLDGKTPERKKPGPRSRLDEYVERLRLLSRRDQAQVLEVIDALLMKHGG